MSMFEDILKAKIDSKNNKLLFLFGKDFYLN